MEWLRFDWELFFVDLLKLSVAFLVTLPIAWEREQSMRIMGLRTFSLVAVASCGYVLVAIAIVGSDNDEQARIVQGLMSSHPFTD